MTWGNTANTFLTRQLNTYEEAKAHYESVVPLRKGSSNENARPIGFRRYTWGTIVEGPKDSIGNAEYYAARFYNTDCVIWRQPRNGKEIVDFNCGGYVTPSTAKFMHYICPEHIYCHMELHRIRANGHPIPLTTNTDRNTAPEYLTMEGTPDAVKVGNYIWAPLNSTKEYVHQIDRSALNEVRRQFKPFLNWYKGYFKIMEGRIPLQYINEVIGDFEYANKSTPKLIGGKPKDATRFLELISDTGSSQYESFLHATYWMANVHCNIGGYYSGDTVDRHKKLDIKLADRIIGAVHANKVLIKIPLALGEIRKDKYASWIYNGEQ